jgi:hypothetical protein
LCAEVRLTLKTEGLIRVETPFYFPDGDPYQMYLQEMSGGIIRLTDMGHTWMRLSYEQDIDKFREGTRGKLLGQIIAEVGLTEDQGVFYLECPAPQIGVAMFRFAQGLTKICDLTFLNRARAESTFYEDLKEQLYKILDPEKITRDYIPEGLDHAEDYPIDFRIEGKFAPLYLFGIPNKDKARLTTIILERLLRNGSDFDSLLIFSDQSLIPKPDLARLSNAGGEMIASLDATQDLSRKLLRKVG